MTHTLQKTLLAIMVIPLLMVALPAFAQEDTSAEDSGGVFSTLRERQLENRREIREKFIEARQEERSRRQLFLNSLINMRFSRALDRVMHGADLIEAKLETLGDDTAVDTEAVQATIDEARALIDDAAEELESAEYFSDALVEVETITHSDRQTLRESFKIISDNIKEAHRLLQSLISDIQSQVNADENEEEENEEEVEETEQDQTTEESDESTDS